MNYRLIDNYENLSYKERYNKATHYYNTDLDNHRSLLGFVDSYGGFVSVLINVHRSKVKKDFLEYDAFKMKK